MDVQKNYKYYAFISYSRKNSQAAAYLQRKLERFRIPVQKVDKQLLLPEQKYIKPVFRDKRDLEVSEKSFTENIKTAIKETRYLLVLCSPESASSYWVAEEIKYFLETHNNDFSLVVPVVFSGNPGSNDETECLPEILRRNEITDRNLPRMVADEGENVREGWENGLIQTISYMLKVKRESIKASIDAERVRFLKRCIFITIFALLIFIALTVWALHAEKKAGRNEIKAKEQTALARKNESIAKEQTALARKNESIAKEQTALAKQSFVFLSDIFKTADPMEFGSKDMKVLDAINKRLPEIEKLKDWRLKAFVATEVGAILDNLGNSNKSLELLQQAIALYGKNNSNSEEAASAYNNIGVAYDNRGDYKNALIYMKKGLEMRKQLLPENHSDIATSYNNIAGVYGKLGNFDEALRYYGKSMEIKHKILPENHKYIPAGYHNIATVYLKKADYTNALKYHKISLNGWEKIYSGDHIDIAFSYTLAGQIYSAMGKYDETLKCDQKSLEIRKKVLPAHHPYIARGISNIGMICHMKGEYEKALEYFQEALSVYRKTYSTDNIDIAVVYNGMGITYSSLRKFDKALKCFQKSLAVYEKHYPADHLEFSRAFINIGRAYSGQRKYQEALKYFQKALDILKKTHKGDHPDIAILYNNFGSTYLLSGKFKEAHQYIKMAYEVSYRLFGENHPNTKVFKQNLDFVKLYLK